MTEAQLVTVFGVHCPLHFRSMRSNQSSRLMSLLGRKESSRVFQSSLPPRLGPYRHARPRSDPPFRYSRDFPTSSSYLPTLRILCTPCRNQTYSPSVKLTECSNTSMARPMKLFTLQRLTPSPWHAARYFSCRLPSSSSGRLLCHGDGALQGNRTHSYRRERPVSLPIDEQSDWRVQDSGGPPPPRSYRQLTPWRTRLDRAVLGCVTCSSQSPSCFRNDLVCESMDELYHSFLLCLQEFVGQLQNCSIGLQLVSHHGSSSDMLHASVGVMSYRSKTNNIAALCSVKQMLQECNEILIRPRASESYDLGSS